jgi:hypothetical protein
MKWTSVRSLPRVLPLAIVGIVFVLLAAPVSANPQPVVGACCMPYGECQVLDAYACTQAGGTYQGDWTVCDPNPCSPGHFACCFPDGNCIIMTSPPLCESQGGVLHQNEFCYPDVCPPAGACCFTNGSCELLTQAACVARSAGWMGVAFTCSPNPCPTAGLPEPDRQTKNRTWGQLKRVFR